MVANASGRRLDIIQQLHSSTKRDYVGRVNEHDKAESAEVACLFGRDYWDGDRRYGYGGYKYDGRWAPIAQRLASEYALKAGDRVLDVGCGKAFLLYELTQVVPGLVVHGIDVSSYGIEHAKEEVRANLAVASAEQLPFDNGTFDLVISLATLHNLHIEPLFRSLREIERVSKKSKYIMVESYRNEREKANLIYWQLTCKSFYSVTDWEWIFNQTGYTGDYGFIFFE